MADYYPLIARAISGLDPSASGESRRALYERARSALIGQLRSIDPPLTESEITRERLALEESIRKVESEAAQRARELSKAESRARTAEAARNTLGRGNVKPPAESPATVPASAQADARTRSEPAKPTAEEPAKNTSAEVERSEPRQQRVLRVDPPPIPKSSPPMTPPAPANQSEPQSAPVARQSEPVKPPVIKTSTGLSDIAADADDLGRATAQANRSARQAYSNGSSPSERLDPMLDDRTGGFSDIDTGSAPIAKPRPRTDAGKLGKPPKALKAAKPPKPMRAGPTFPLKIAVITGVALLAIGAAIVFAPGIMQTIRGGSSTSGNTVEQPLSQRPKIADRIGQSGLSDQIAPVAQRVVLYDEDPAEPKGKQYVGTVVWRIDPINNASGKPSDIAIRADIDIPERQMKMTMSFRRNTDNALPASHTAELTFSIAGDDASTGVSNVPGILMKSNEQARGTPLAGLAVKVTDGFFLVGLSNVESDKMRNLQLLKERSWFDVPLVYSNQRRAIIAVEKGEPGERAFTEAFAAWAE